MKCLVSVSIFVLLLNKEGQSLDCYVCHSRQNPDCGDPFPRNGNATGQILLHQCERVRKVGEGLVAASNAIGGPSLDFTPLDIGPHSCYKISIGEHAVRGCGKPDFCRNMSDVCKMCNSDGCNSARKPRASIFDISIPLFSFLTFYT